MGPVSCFTRPAAEAGGGGFGVWFGCLYSPLMGGHCSSSVIEQWCRQRGQIEGQTGETDGGQTVEADRGTDSGHTEGQTVGTAGF